MTAAPRPSLPLRYAVALCSVALAAFATHALRNFADFGISPLFFAAVLVSAFYGGIGPGLLATVLSDLATSYLLAKPHGLSWAMLGEHVPRLFVFTSVSLLAGALNLTTRRAREAAESASEAKSRFLAMVSHELRAPLSPVLVATEFLESDPRLPPELAADVRTIRRNVDLEIRLIDDLVDLTRVTAGKMSLRTEPLDVHDVIRSAAAVCTPDANDKGVTLTLHLNATRSRVSGDPVRLQQVFWNLLRNAIKFTPDAGHVTVTTRDAPAGVQVDVADTGLGIEPAHLPVIFDAFEQGGADIHHRFGGLGLGLAIVKALVTAHHGAVTATSPGRGAGSTFTVTLPTESVTSPAPI